MRNNKMITKRIAFIALITMIFPFHIGGVFAENGGQVRQINFNTPITSPKCNEFTFDATGSYDPDSENLSFTWDFGDGLMSYEPIVMHSYDQSGDYEVKLTINDNSGAENSVAITTQIVRSNVPPYAVINVPDKICINEPALFDGTDSYDDVSSELKFKWNFGDGMTSMERGSVSKTYSKAGLYTATLTVDDNSQTICSSHTSEKFIYVNAPPVAEAGKDEVQKCVKRGEDLVIAFDASSSKDPNGDPLSFRWDFADGFTYDGVNTNHRFAEPGIYDVQLVVSDSSNVGCGKAIDFVKVQLDYSPQADAGQDIVACPGEVIEFDGSNSYIPQKGTDISQWFFGDGLVKTGLIVQHSYPKPGRYQASLMVENKINAMCPSSRDTIAVIVNSTPKVSIKSDDTICLGESLQFDASTGSDPDGDQLEYYWSFGDGSILKAGPVANHEYKHGGEYRVSVVVDDLKNTSCSTASSEKTIRVNTPPIADAGPNLSCCVEMETTFSGTSSTDPDGDQLSYSWDLGDGSRKDGAVVTHKFRKSGSYSVVLTVDDNSGTSCSRSTASYVAQANAQPVPKISVR